VSTKDKAHWQFRPLNPNENSGASTTDDNFADEERTSVEILIRETLQNPLDARRDDSVVRVEYRIVSVELSASQFSRSIFSDNWVTHFQAGDLVQEGQKPTSLKFLVIEDFGTTGLEGSYSDSSIEGQTENWNAFWFREGEGAKPSRSNGGAGQGKITLYLASKLRSVFALTKRASDGVELLFGCCRFRRNYKLPNDTTRWAKEARWGAQRDPQVQATPILDAALVAQVKTELSLSRAGEAGTSFIVPMPIDDISEGALLDAVVNEFFFAIRRGRLVVKVGNTQLDSNSIGGIAEGMGDRCRLPRQFRAFLAAAASLTEASATATAQANWVKDAKLTDSAFDPKQLADLKTEFEASRPVCVDFPVTIKKKAPKESATALFRVFLQQDETSEQSQELFVRQDLGIDGEKRLRAARTIVPVMALTFIHDSRLSDLLVAAEEPTHRNWNAKRPKVLATYVTPNDALNAVRNAALRLVQLISPVGKKDETALANYFNDPLSDGNRKSGSSGDKPDTPGDSQNVPEIVPRPKPIVVKPRVDGFEIHAKSAEGVAFPIRCKVELAYATVVGDPFRLWDAADFWVADKVRHPKELSAITDLSYDLNRIEFEMDNEHSYLKVSGFDPNRQVVIRAKFEEVSNGTGNSDN